MFLILLSLLMYGLTAQGGQSVAPLAGYAPTYGAFGGVGHFWENRTLRSELFGVISTSGSMQAEYRFLKRGGWSTDNRLVVKKGFENFYGFDGSNQVEARALDLTEFQVQLQGMRRISERLKTGVGLGWAHRKGEILYPQFFPLHQVWSVQALADWEDLLTLTMDYSFLLRGNSNLRLIVEFVPEVDLGGNWKLAFRAKLGTTFGPWDPLTEFSLGGSDQLRGYLTQRFRGKHLYLLETALRFPLWWRFRGAVFAGAGDAFLETGTGPKAAAGVGLHFALPPDGVQVVRLDVGRGADQWGAYLDFGLPF